MMVFFNEALFPTDSALAQKQEDHNFLKDPIEIFSPRPVNMITHGIYQQNRITCNRKLFGFNSYLRHGWQ